MENVIANTEMRGGAGFFCGVVGWEVSWNTYGGARRGCPIRKCGWGDLA